MKKAILFFVLLVAQICCAQYVEATPNGIEGVAQFKTTENMHAATLDYLKRNYSGETVTSTNNYIRVEGLTKSAVVAKKGMFKESFDAYYSVVFEFTDTTVRIYFTDVDFKIGRYMSVEPRLTFQGGETFAVFDKKGEVKSATTKLNVEMFFNNIVNKLKREIYAKG